MDAENVVREIVSRIAKRPDPAALPPDADLFRDLGVESTAALDLLLSLEEAFGVSIPDDAFGEARSVRELIALVQRLT
jgi:acyl carrier protein